MVCGVNDIYRTIILIIWLTKQVLGRTLSSVAVDGASQMDETPLITKIELTESFLSASATPAIRYRVTAQTENGQLVLWISRDAAKELVAHFATRSDERGSE